MLNKKETLVLEGDDDEYLSVRLSDILIHVGDLSGYRWKIVWLDATSTRMNVVELEERINGSDTGFDIEGSELIPFSKQFQQLIEMVLIGDADVARLVKSDDEELMKANCEFFIRLVDSSYWEVTSGNKVFMDNVRSSLV